VPLLPVDPWMGWPSRAVRGYVPWAALFSTEPTGDLDLPLDYSVRR
jgi:hypothetical protein